MFGVDTTELVLEGHRTTDAQVLGGEPLEHARARLLAVGLARLAQLSLGEAVQHLGPG